MKEFTIGISEPSKVKCVVGSTTFRLRRMADFFGAKVIPCKRAQVPQVSRRIDISEIEFAWSAASSAKKRQDDDMGPHFTFTIGTFSKSRIRLLIKMLNRKGDKLEP